MSAFLLCIICYQSLIYTFIKKKREILPELNHLTVDVFPFHRGWTFFSAFEIK